MVEFFPKFSITIQVVLGVETLVLTLNTVLGFWYILRLLRFLSTYAISTPKISIPHS